MTVCFNTKSHKNIILITALMYSIFSINSSLEKKSFTAERMGVKIPIPTTQRLPASSKTGGAENRCHCIGDNDGFVLMNKTLFT